MKSDRLYSVVLNRSKSSKSFLLKRMINIYIYIIVSGQNKDLRTASGRGGSASTGQGNNRISATEMGCY